MHRAEFQKIYEMEGHYWWYRGLRVLTRDAIDRYAPRCTSLLDAGCGTGGLLAELGSGHTGCRRVGVDLSREAVEFCHRRELREILCASLNEIALKSSSFDVITCTDVLYMDGIDERCAVNEIHRLLRPGGVLIVNVAAFEFLRGSHDRFVRTRHRFRRGEAIALLREAGFEIQKASYWNATLFPVVALIRLVRGHRAAATESDLRPIAPAMNRVLTMMVGLEARWLRRWSLPFGTSVFCVARKPEGVGSGMLRRMGT